MIRTDNGLLDVAVVGGSQAGLAMAWHLAREQLRFVVLDAGPGIGHTWRSRWDSLTLFTPAQYNALPGMRFPGRPDTYPTKDGVVGYLQAYAAAFNLPVRLNAPVTQLRQAAEGFEIRTQKEVFRARQVVVATGPFQVPHVPAAAQRLDGSVTQLHSAAYRNHCRMAAGPPTRPAPRAAEPATPLRKSQRADTAHQAALPRCADAEGSLMAVVAAPPPGEAATRL
jgi:putative flavoprotein involved in K+ transport